MAETTPKPSTPLKAPDFLVYNTLGLRPVKSVFHLDCEAVENMIRQIASREIDGIKDVTHEFDSKTGAVGWFIWFDSNCEHFVDKSTQNTALGKNLSRYSQKFQDFAKKFGWRESDDDPEHGDSTVRIKQIVRTNANREIRQSLTCLQVALNQFLVVAFDVRGVAYQKEYGLNTPKVFLNRRYNWRQTNGNKFGSLTGLEITKELASVLRDYGRPRANRSGNFT